MKFFVRIFLSVVLFLFGSGKEATAKPIPTVHRCAQWMSLAIQAGWRTVHLPVLDYIIWQESRCEPHQINKTLNKDGSWDYGLTQINDRSWCKPTRWYKQGYLQSLGIVGYCDDLLTPINNLKAAKALHDYSQKTNGNGFQPWGL